MRWKPGRARFAAWVLVPVVLLMPACRKANEAMESANGTLAVPPAVAASSIPTPISAPAVAATAPVSRLTECSAEYQQFCTGAIEAALAGKDLGLLRSRLEAQLERTWPGGTITDAQLRSPVEGDVSMALAQHAFVRLCQGPEVQRTLDTPHGGAFLRTLLTDRAWLETFLTSGLLADGASAAAAHLGAIWADDPGCAADRTMRNLSVACALVFAQPYQRGRVTSASTPVDRYRFFRDSHRAGKLHRLFDRLEAWEMRYVADATWDDRSLAWTQENVRVPLSRFGDTCWLAEYRGSTVFGDSIQGADFYTPWSEAMTHAENVVRHGGVCGSLSHLGAMSACARGVPAGTMGQPGHCAYGYRPEAGRWVGGFGGPDGWCHSGIHGHHSAYRDMTEDALGDRAASLSARRLAWLAAFSAGRGDRRSASRALDRAVLVQPTDYESWLEAIDLRLAGKEASRADWVDLTTRMASAFRRHPVILFDLLGRYDRAIPGLADNDLVTLWKDLHVQVATAWKHPSWLDLPHVLDSQARRLGGNAAAKETVAEVALLGTRSSATTLPAAIGWAQKQFAGNEAAQNRWIALLTRSLADLPGAAGRKDLRKVYDQAIVAAEQAGATEAFHALTAQALRLRPDERPQRMPAFKPFAGELLTRGGLLRPSSTCGWDDPARHAAVLEGGGKFHTDAEVRPSVEARLPRLGQLSGIVVVSSDGSTFRVPPLKVSVSEDGKTWKAIHRATRDQAVYAIPVNDPSLRVRHVRVERDDDRKEFFHLRGLFVYGRAVQ